MRKASAWKHLGLNPPAGSQEGLFDNGKELDPCEGRGPSPAISDRIADRLEPRCSMMDPCIRRDTASNPKRTDFRPFHSINRPRSAMKCSRGVCDESLRSEEHTSELQSLMRTSYAVFCLKKQKNCTTDH